MTSILHHLKGKKRNIYYRDIICFISTIIFWDKVYVLTNDCKDYTAMNFRLHTATKKTVIKPAIFGMDFQVFKV